MILHHAYEAMAAGFNEETFRRLEAEARGRSPVLSRISRTIVAHLTEGDVSASAPVKTAPMPIDVSLYVSRAAAESGDASAFVSEIDKTAENLTSQLSRQMYDAIDKSCEEAGTTVDAKGRPFSADILCEALEKIEIEFDSNGRAVMPEIVVHPSKMDSLRRVLEDPETQRRIDQIIRKKFTERYSL